MSVIELLRKAEFLVDAQGNKKAVMFDIASWEELLDTLEELEDAEEIQHLRSASEKAIDWQEAKKELRATGIDV